MKAPQFRTREQRATWERVQREISTAVDTPQFDYDKQAYIIDGHYVRCGHPEAMDCRCYGRLHAGERAPNIR